MPQKTIVAVLLGIFVTIAGCNAGSPDTIQGKWKAAHEPIDTEEGRMKISMEFVKDEIVVSMEFESMPKGEFDKTNVGEERAKVRFIDGAFITDAVNKGKPVRYWLKGDSLWTEIEGESKKTESEKTEWVRVRE